MSHYNVIIIGAGMSGLAAGIRAKMLGHEKVAVVEAHTIAGGLNSYYKRGKRQFDVGLHALTNFAKPGAKNSPLLKICKQLRIPHQKLQLQEQAFSEISFPFGKLKFGNNFSEFQKELKNKFPDEEKGMLGLFAFLEQFNETDIEAPFLSTRKELARHLKNQELIEMLLWPLMIYGSAIENDMDFGQFAIMFKAIFKEGFSRPMGGVRTIIELLAKRFQEEGGEIFYGQKVAKIISNQSRVVTQIAFENGIAWTADHVLSSAGLVETYKLAGLNHHDIPVGKMAFTESIFVFDKLPEVSKSWPTIMFYSGHQKAMYKKPDEFTYYDGESAVICIPNRYERCEYNEPVIRVTFPANYDLWNMAKRQSAQFYKEQKELVADSSMKLLAKVFELGDAKVVFKDVFTPTSVERYTGHAAGAVYGSPEKIKNGRTPIERLLIIGTDQGFLGVVGAILSGISMANLHLFQPYKQSQDAQL